MIALPFRTPLPLKMKEQEKRHFQTLDNRELYRFAINLYCINILHLNKTSTLVRPTAPAQPKTEAKRRQNLPDVCFENPYYSNTKWSAGPFRQISRSAGIRPALFLIDGHSGDIPRWWPSQQWPQRDSSRRPRA
jgi:hypothetical protein